MTWHFSCLTKNHFFNKLITLTWLALFFIWNVKNHDLRNLADEREWWARYTLSWHCMIITIKNVSAKEAKEIADFPLPLIETNYCTYCMFNEQIKKWLRYETHLSNVLIASNCWLKLKSRIFHCMWLLRSKPTLP